MTRAFSERSENRLKGVHPHLVDVVRDALQLSEVDFAVIEGLRTKERQEQLVKAGASQTMNSRHITGHAVDLAPLIGGEVRWDWPPFYLIARAMRDAALKRNVPLVWGGTWRATALLPEKITAANLSRSFPDGPHFELDRKVYP